MHQCLTQLTLEQEHQRHSKTTQETTWQRHSKESLSTTLLRVKTGTGFRGAQYIHSIESKFPQLSQAPCTANIESDRSET